MRDATPYDVVVLGNGLTGSALAAVLARQGVRTALVSADTHPRYTTGEIATPNTTALLRMLAARYDVPELADLVTARQVRARLIPSVGAARANSFVYHRPGQPRSPGEVLQMAPPKVMPAPPILYRQDVDAHVFHTAVRHGAAAYQQAAVTTVEVDRDGVLVGTGNGHRLRARYVVDTGGRHTPLVELFGVRAEPSRLRHRSYVMHTHMVNVRPFDELTRDDSQRPPVPWGDGPLHHVFDGGYVWVLPFGNDGGTNATWSVGAALLPGGSLTEDPRPWRRLLDTFPDLGRQLRDARPVQPWTVLPLAQHSARTSVGDRWCALGEAAGFVDPLMSRSLLHGLAGVNFLAWRLLAAVADNDFSSARFRFLDDFTQRSLDADDRLVRAFYAATRDYRLWKALVQVWEIGNFYGRLTVERALADWRAGGGETALRRLESAKYLGLPFPSDETYHRLFERACVEVDDVSAGRVDPGHASDRLYAEMAATGLVPPGLGLGVAELRFLHPRPTDLVRVLLWGRRRAPESVRPLIAQLTGSRRSGPDPRAQRGDQR